MSDQRLSAGLTGQLEQRLHLSQNMQRSLELLALPLPALDLRLAEELAGNPLLTEEESPLPESAAAASEEKQQTEDENDYESNSILADEWCDQLPLPGNGGSDEERGDYFSTIPAPPPSLNSLLTAEIHALDLPENIRKCALEIISALDDDGFLKTPPADLAMICNAGMDEVDSALKVVQDIAPAGVGARNLPECLKLQLIRKGQLTPVLEKLLDEGVSDLEKNRLDLLVKKLMITPGELEKMLKILRTLNPHPGRQESSAGSVVIPDLVIARNQDGSYTVHLRESRKIGIQGYYEKLLNDDTLSAEDRAFLTEKYNGAKEFLRALEMRGTTLKQLGDLLIEVQKEFLDCGVEFLKPLTMKQAAESLGVNESTVSRTVAGKYAETPQGVLPLKNFFSTGVNSQSGEDVSNQAVMEKIRQLIAQEEPSSPLSDEAIAGLLKKSGIPVARRTVAKYRDILKIPSSSLRKKFF